MLCELERYELEHLKQIQKKTCHDQNSYDDFMSKDHRLNTVYYIIYFTLKKVELYLDYCFITALAKSQF